jgi:hypothetical protein
MDLCQIQLYQIVILKMIFIGKLYMPIGTGDANE